MSLQYVLITPARNEESLIELTIQSVVQQTIRPLKWVIVSDGSTDRTDEIVQQYAREYNWIDFVRMPDRDGRHFGGKVSCINTGRARLTGLAYDIIGSLDADLSFDREYFEFLLHKFAGDPGLGLAGTPFTEEGLTYDYRFSSTEHVSGACQLFRRECFEAIGGYVPLKGGGIDDVAVVSARMMGWRTKTFTEMTTRHHRPMGTGNNGHKIAVSFQSGQRAYRLGWHPVWQIFRSAYQMTRKPYVAGGAALLLGYAYAFLRRADRPVTQELIEYQRRDQMRRLRAFFRIGPSSGSQFAVAKGRVNPGSRH
jgi:biofilm PGA synthesis N-glycosyltransferase PgaC